MNAFLKSLQTPWPYFPSEHIAANKIGRLCDIEHNQRRSALSARSIEAMIRRCGLRMIEAITVDYELSLHWYYRVRHYAELAGR
jgi:hypothetical protein